MLDDDLDDVDKRASGLTRTQRQPPQLPAKTGSIRSIVGTREAPVVGRETESAKKSKFTIRIECETI